MNININEIIESYLALYPSHKQTNTSWKKPLVKVASAHNPAFQDFKKIVRESHALPTDLLAEAESVITFFLPFGEGVAKSNVEGNLASHEWAVAYTETNTLIADISTFLIKYFETNGYLAATVPATHNFDKASLMSDWSHRHVAEIAGLGGFGLNNMLITEAGCCGRFGTVVTSAVIKPDIKEDKSFCLYHANGTCGVCVDKCPKNAFGETYDRHKCYEMCLENDAYHETLGLVDVCGKCCVALPCSYKNPCK